MNHKVPLFIQQGAEILSLVNSLELSPDILRRIKRNEATIEDTKFIISHLNFPLSEGMSVRNIQKDLLYFLHLLYARNLIKFPWLRKSYEITSMALKLNCQNLLSPALFNQQDGYHYELAESPTISLPSNYNPNERKESSSILNYEDLDNSSPESVLPEDSIDNEDMVLETILAKYRSIIVKLNQLNQLEVERINKLEKIFTLISLVFYKELPHPRLFINFIDGVQLYKESPMETPPIDKKDRKKEIKKTDLDEKLRMISLEEDTIKKLNNDYKELNTIKSNLESLLENEESFLKWITKDPDDEDYIHSEEVNEELDQNDKSLQNLLEVFFKTFSDLKNTLSPLETKIFQQLGKKKISMREIRELGNVLVKDNERIIYSYLRDKTYKQEKVDTSYDNIHEVEEEELVGEEECQTTSSSQTDNEPSQIFKIDPVNVKFFSLDQQILANILQIGDDSSYKLIDNSMLEKLRQKNCEALDSIWKKVETFSPYFKK